ncbi:ABC transporter ATP-binding protein [Pseudodesulfovibrio thermohalotolerans]|uniref:ABC transporter ATP-binding protein n=1 Tax=Pseudodesulfovibrio thermohalotolerans TaxID=2880651 RepID=UPI0024437385|nr:ABC transporter ATP-binding protein [Pseudodesulfovibrio thermohalotolerans]WFS61212.1 ABC transporter ATP-binding protein [Pseudodesulfovibrio thermohalotolerans]
MSQYDLRNIEHFDNRHLLKRCVSYFKPHAFKIVIGMISAIIVSGTSAATAYLVKPAMDNVFIQKDSVSLVLVPLAFFSVIVVKSIFRFTQVYLMNVTGLLVLYQLRNEMFSRIILLPLRFFEESQVGMLMSRVLGDVNGIRESVPTLVMSIREFITIIGLVGVVFYQNWKLAVVSIIVLPTCAVPIIHFGKRLRMLGRRLQAQGADINSVLQENFSAIRLIKAFNTESKEAKRFKKENFKIVGLSKKQVLASEMSSRIMELAGGVAISGVLWYGGKQVLDGVSTPGTFFSFVTALIMLYEPIKKINDSNKVIQKSLASAERVFGLLDSTDIRPEENGNIPFERPLETLEIKDVTFTYPTVTTPALKNFSLTINRNERIALVGPSGSGKTTLVNLFPRFYDVDCGEISYNGTPLRELELGSLRRSIGIVSQDPILFNRSIRENIAYGSPGVTEEQIIEAAKFAYAHEFIELLPEGYDTICGERGVKLSGGQKQRITIARALIKNPALLILDEATSALDTQSERIVQMALQNLMQDRTSVVIAHRLSTVINADRIVVMQKGEVVGVGNHAELLETCPLYAKLHSMQFCETLSDDEVRQLSVEG